MYMYICDEIFVLKIYVFNIFISIFAVVLYIYHLYAFNIFASALAFLRITQQYIKHMPYDKRNKKAT